MSERASTVLSLFGVNPRRIGGVEMFARELSRQITAQGWRSVLVFLGAPPPNVRSYLEMPHVAIDEWNESGLSGANTRHFRRLLKRYRPAVVHLHFTGFLTPYPWLARLHGVRRIFISDHSSRPENYAMPSAPLWKRLAARGINSPVTNVIAVSDYGRRCLGQLGTFPARRIELIYNAVDVRRNLAGSAAAARFRRKYDIPDGCLLVTQVSWMTPEKGVPDLLEAARLVIAREPAVHFAIVGDGRCEREYRQMARDMGIASKVRFTGLIDDPFGEGVYSASNIFCLVSRWEELFGWVIAEAMLHGNPVIATRAGGIPELVSDGATGRLVPRRDPRAIADAILELADDPVARQRMGRAGHEAIMNRFALEPNVARLGRLYGLAGAAPARVSSAAT